MTLETRTDDGWATTRFVVATFASNGSLDPSYMIEPKPSSIARTARSASSA